MFRAGTYVTGMQLPIGASFETSRSPVSADGAQVQRHDLERRAQRPRDPLGRRQLVRVPLPVSHRERVRREAILLRDRQAGAGVEPAREEDDGGAHQKAELETA